MFFRFVFLVVSLMSFLRGCCVSSCAGNCTDKPEFSPSRLVVKHGDPASASCSVCQRDCIGNLFDMEKSVGNLTTNGTMISWTVDSLTEWNASPMCYYNHASGHQCCTTLPVTVYKLPDKVSLSFLDHTGPMVEGHNYTLLCEVKDVAPAENLIVTFYRGQTAERHYYADEAKKPLTWSVPLEISPSKEDDGVQYWCEAKLQLGPGGPQPPPVVMSQNITASVHYKPQLQGSSHPDQITITEGNPLQLNCSAEGNPRPSYTWTLPSANPVPSTSSVLTISSVTPADEGQYTCSVSNYMGTVSVTFDVVVQGLVLTSTRLPPATTTPTTTTTATTTTTTTTTTTPTTTTTTTPTPTLPNSTSSALLHRFIMCFTLLFSALV